MFRERQDYAVAAIEEAETHERLHHPNIVKLVHWFHDHKRFYMVQALCINGTLVNKRQKRRQNKYQFVNTFIRKEHLIFKL